MILSDIDIRKHLGEHSSLVEPFCEDRLQGASYDLSISDKIAVFKKQVCTIDLADQSAIDGVYEQQTLSASGYVLNPGEYILVTVSEKLNIPINMVAHIRPRTRFTRLGVIVSAQHCNPGYSGVLQLGMFNASPNAIVIKPNLRVAQVVFEELTSPASSEKQYQNKHDAAYMGENEFRGAIFGDSELPPEAKAIFDEILKKIEEA